MIRNINLWMISNEDEFQRFVMNKGWVVLISENPSPILKNHPSSLGASILLPPYESIAAEIDGNNQLADEIYINYLNSEICTKYINAILVAILANTAIGLYFDQEAIETRCVKTFLNYLYNVYGISVGAEGRVIPTLNETFLPYILERLYINDAIDYEVFMINHPDMPISPSVISKMAVEQNPLVPSRDFNTYYAYFTNVLRSIKSNNNRFLIDPIRGD